MNLGCMKFLSQSSKQTARLHLTEDQRFLDLEDLVFFWSNVWGSLMIFQGNKNYVEVILL